jgi:hypothetical protein
MVLRLHRVEAVQSHHPEFFLKKKASAIRAK